MKTLRDLIAQLNALAEQNPELLNAPVITPVTEDPIYHELAHPIIEVTRVVLDEDTETGLFSDTYFAEEHEQELQELGLYDQSILAIRIG